MDCFRDFRTIFKTEFQIVTQRSIGWFAALARRFKHIGGPNVSFRDRGIALRCRDGNDPLGTTIFAAAVKQSGRPSGSGRACCGGRRAIKSPSQTEFRPGLKVFRYRRSSRQAASRHLF
jgi:hypothetical protein